MRTSFQICIFALVALIVGVAAPRVNAQCTGDVVPSGEINGVDLSQILADWGPCTNCLGDIDGDGAVTGNDLGQLLAGWGPCPPFIASVAPGQGTIVGGTLITISGAYMTGVTNVIVGGIPATNMVVVSPTTITAVTPAHASGSVSLTVTTPSRTTTLQNGFSYAAVSSWATLIETLPDPEIVTDATLRAAIISTGLPWRVRHNGTSIEMLLIPPGTFTIGCSLGETACNANESPSHQVTLTSGFYVGRTEVTQAQWQATIGSNPSLYQGYADSPSRPVERVSWNDVQSFNDATDLRLPTEAEWEFASRAGTTTSLYGSLDGIAWWAGNNGPPGSPSYGTKPCATKPSNALGLYDMIGNVWEFANDRYGGYTSAPSTNPIGPPIGGERVIRGGGWTCWEVRASTRSSLPPDYNWALIGAYGFRVARNP